MTMFSGAIDPVFRNCPAIITGEYTGGMQWALVTEAPKPTSGHHVPISSTLFHPKRQRSTSHCSSRKSRRPSLAMIKPRSADRGIRLKVRSRKWSTLGAVVEPTFASSSRMISGASIWATSRERRTCGKSTARSSLVSSKTKQQSWQAGWWF